MQPIVSVKGVTKSYASGFQALQLVNLDIAKGEIFALLGPNGAGKTTLINLITGMLQPDVGQIFLGDEEITRLGPEQRVRRGLVRTFQINTLFPNLTALEAVTLAVCERRGDAKTWWHPVTAYSEAVDEAYAILTSLLLAPVCNRPTRELAYGQQRLLEIALALATKPKVLLLDEPAAGVPEEERRDILAALAAQPSDVAILLIEHDMDLVFNFAQRISVLVGGKLLTEGEPEAIAADERVRAVYLGEDAHG
jgi:branched-chain amino acid transport system ATP-binding protein